MYSVFEQLLQEKGVSRYQVSKETGIPQTTLSTWKVRGTDPSVATMKKLADYFGVTMEYLATGVTSDPVTSEIAAIKKEDISGNRLHIHRSLARDIEGIVSEKTPKTPAGDRTIVIPDFILGKLDPDKIPSLGGISSAYVRAMKKSGLEHFKFHSLRHFYASWMHLAGYPDKYIMKLGGWGDVTTLQRIYQHALPDVAEEIGTESALRAEQMFKCDRV